MSKLLDRIQAAQVSAGEMAVMQDLHEKGFCNEHCPFHPAITRLTEDEQKDLAAVLASLKMSAVEGWYFETGHSDLLLKYLEALAARAGEKLP